MCDRAYRLTRASVAGTAGALLLFAGASSASASPQTADYGVLQRFAPQSATTWWAVVQSNLTSRGWVVRTADSGTRWRDVTPPTKIVVSSAFVGVRTGWIEGASSGAAQPIFRTADSGRTWRLVGKVPTECQLDFVDARHGWCTSINGAAGSETVALFRTATGGATWNQASHTGLYDKSSTPGAMPFACDKTIAFTSPMVGWAAQYCNGGDPRLYLSNDGGSRWKPLAPVTLPKEVLPSAGVGLSLPARARSSIAVSVNVGGLPHGATLIATSENSGRSWQTQRLPGPLRYWTVDLIDVRQWVAGDGTTLLSTGDAGRHWHTSTPTVRMKDSVGGPLDLHFLSSQLGFAVPNGNGGPLWWTRDGGGTWRSIKITAGPFTVPRS